VEHLKPPNLVCGAFQSDKFSKGRTVMRISELFRPFGSGNPFSSRQKRKSRTVSPASAEVLELRQLLVAQVTQMGDLNLVGETGGSDPQELTQVGNTLFFTASDKTHGRELWKKEGTNAAVLVRDIFVGTDSSNIRELTAVGSTLYFSAYNGIHGQELWKSDGTTAGTVMVKDFWGDAGDSSSFSFSSHPQQLTNANGKLFYVADPEAAGSGIVASLLTTDGTAAGTQVINSSIGAVATGDNSRLTAVGSEVYFWAWSPGNNHGAELWKSDGTTAGTVEIADVWPGTGSPVIDNITPAGSVTYFTAWYSNGSNGSHNNELWKTDGTAAGTVLVKDIRTGDNSSDPLDLTWVNGTLYFTADDGVNGRELWKSNGTAAGTVMVKDILPGASGSSPGNLTAVGGTLYFSASDGITGDELWKSNGTAAGTVRVGHSGTSANFTPRNLTSIGGSLYFSAFTFETGFEVWKSDGTTAGTNVYKDLLSGAGSSGPNQFLNVNGVLYYTANNGVNGRELWRHDVTTNTAVVSDVFRGTVNSGPRSFTAVGSNVFFLADNGINGEELWKCNANGTGAVLVKDIYPGANGSQGSDLINVNGTLFFIATDGVNGRELWKSDGTAAGTVLVKDIYAGSDTSTPSGLVNLNGTLLFSAWGSNGQELWKSNGTAAGTVEVKDIRTGAVGSIDRFTNNFVVIGSTAYFAADDGTGGRELWKTNGTTAGTVQVKDIRTGSTGSGPENLVDVNGRLYFTADNGASGRELWQSDGTAAGTILAKDTNPGANGAVFKNFVNAGGKLFFEAYSGTGSWDLFCRATPASDTVNLQMFNASGHTRWVEAPLTAVGTSVFFAQLDNRTGTELWQSDGTAAGTVMVKDIASTMTPTYSVDSWGSNPLYLVNNNGTLFFTANDMINGQEIWMSDGTSAGTKLFADLTGDAGSSHPEHLTAINGRIFASVMSETTGREAISLIDVVVPTAPTITAPTSATRLQRPEITWTASQGAVSYDLYIRNNSTGANPQVSINVTGTSWVPTSDLGIGRFVVWVRAVNAAGTKSAWSAQRNFIINTSPTTAPIIRHQQTNRPEIVWDDITGAVKYDVWLDSVTAGQVSTQILHNVMGKSWQSPTDLPLGQYRAWVRGLDASGLAAAWAPIINFNVTTAPALITPMSSTLSSRPQFTWTPVSSATKYELQLRNLNTETLVYNIQNITTTSWTPPANLPAGHYRWWGLASNANYRGQWSQAVDFYVGGRPVVTAPVGSGTDTTPEFRWNAVEGAATYQLWVDRTDTYVQAVINISGLTGTTFTPVTPLPAGTFRVWVRAISSTGMLSSWSQSLTFSITT
jgi:ELWxxDGT repeat protein